MCAPLTSSDGSVLGVVGPTGAGKTTLVNLLARLFEAQGTIELDGVPIRDLPLATLRGALGYVPQDGFLFSETFRENVGFGAEAPLGDAELARLCEQALLTEEVARFRRRVEEARLNTGPGATVSASVARSHVCRSPGCTAIPPQQPASLNYGDTRHSPEPGAADERRPPPQ